MHAVMFFFLFNEFYKQTYQKKAKMGVVKTTVEKVCSKQCSKIKLHSNSFELEHNRYYK
jgi:hypothetical protein